MKTTGGKIMEYTVNNQVISYQVSGAAAKGKHEVLLHQATDLTAGTSWHDSGFTIETLFNPETFTTFRQEVNKLLLDLWAAAGLSIPQSFPLEKYHTLTDTTEKHLRAVDKTKLLSVDDFPLGIRQIEERISETCSTSLVAKNPFDNASVFHFRVVRPQRNDNNPLHRDVWLEDYDNCINLYIPISGSNERSSLILIPGSHLWPESKIEKTGTGALINGVQYNVPAVTFIEGPYHAVRPDPKKNEVLVFSPYLIHGGAANTNQDTTRISIELRLWKRDHKLYLNL